MKKICFVTTIPATIESFILETAKYLYQEGKYDVTFISSYDSDFEKNIPSYIHYIPLKIKRGIGLDGPKVIRNLYKIFKKEKYDIVQYSTPNAACYASIAARLAKIKVRLYCQWGIRYVGFKGIKKKIFKVIEKIICNNSTWIEPDSFGNLKFSHSEKLYKPTKSSVVWNGSASGVNLQKFDIQKKDIWRNEIRKKYSLDSELVIGFIGRLDRDKGINELFTAFQNINDKNIRLLIIGRNDKLETIDHSLYQWAMKDERVIFTGNVNDVEKYYAAMDIFILPSYREGFGSVVVEAEAMGVPVIVTDIPGPTDAMIKNKTGLVVKKADSESLRIALEKMIKEKEMREVMSKEAIEFARSKFDALTLFKKILTDRSRLIEGS